MNLNSLFTIRILLCLSTLILISACSVRPLQSITDSHWQQRQQQIQSKDKWTIKGRIGIRTPDQSNSSNFSWQHHPQRQQFMLYGAFGNTYADILQTPEKATLALSDDEIYESTDIEALLLRVMGHPLPIEHMRYWIMGIPYPDDSNKLVYDEFGYLTRIHYQQWTISYKNYQSIASFDDIFLPTKITITDGQVILKLSVRNWSMDT